MTFAMVPFDDVDALSATLGGFVVAGSVEIQPATPVMEFQPGASSGQHPEPRLVQVHAL